MQTDNRLLDDLARVATGALGALTGVRSEVESRIREQFERILARMDLVTRDEFEVVKEMASRARSEQEELQRRLTELEARLGAAGSPIVAAEPVVSRPVRRAVGKETPEAPPVA